jgi:hypothetical protein
MEDKIYQILKKHKLPLKKREEVLVDLLLLLGVVGRSEQLVAFLKWVGDGYDFENNAEEIVNDYISEGN